VAQCVCGVFVLLAGAAPLAHAVLLLLWLLLAAFLVRRLHRRLLAWADARLMLTDDLVETMVGYRTMVAQVPPENRHLGEERVLDDYARKEAAMDREMARLAVLIPRGWLVLIHGGPGAKFRGHSRVARRRSRSAWAASAHLPGDQARRARHRARTGRGVRGLARHSPHHGGSGWSRRSRRAGGGASHEIDDATQGRRALLVGRDVSYRYPGRLEPVLARGRF
jgi:hypothetical protein